MSLRMTILALFAVASLASGPALGWSGEGDTNQPGNRDAHDRPSDRSGRDGRGWSGDGDSAGGCYGCIGHDRQRMDQTRRNYERTKRALDEHRKNLRKFRHDMTPGTEIGYDRAQRSNQRGLSCC